MSKPEVARAHLPRARVTGLRAQGVSRFAGIRYAQPLLGPLRFSPPTPLAPQGEVDATRLGPVAPQRPSRLARAVGDFTAEQSEDCLHLTIWTPDADAARRPVLVWLHGGAWQSGGGAIGWYDGSALALRGDLVVVAVNYRLGALGWLCADGAEPNAGLLDQELALAWVAEHIAAFGGDSGRITVMGQSAGAHSAAALLTRPQAVYQRAILQSPPLEHGFRAWNDAYAIGRAVLHGAGVSSVQAARALPVEQLLAAQHSPEVAAAFGALPDALSVFCPVLDGVTLPTDIQPALLRAAARADLLVGTTAHEMAAFPGHGTDAASAARGERVFMLGAHAFAAQATAAGRQAWVYRLDAAPNAALGACHCLELPFVFDTHDAFAHAPMLKGLHARDRERLTRAVQAIWIAFARGEALSWPTSPYVQSIV